MRGRERGEGEDDTERQRQRQRDRQSRGNRCELCRERRKRSGGGREGTEKTSKKSRTVKFPLKSEALLRLLLREKQSSDTVHDSANSPSF